MKAAVRAVLFLIFLLMGEAETSLGVLAGTFDGWRLVSLFYLRSRLVPETRGSGPASQPGWAGVIEFRARMLREEPG